MYHVTKAKTSFSLRANADDAARVTSRRHPATQIGVYFLGHGGKKYVRVYLNGRELPRSVWFAGYR